MSFINIGFTDNRNSSRVLKPPGGFTSDIFGTDEMKRNDELKRLEELKIETVAKEQSAAVVAEKTEENSSSVVVTETVVEVSVEEENKNGKCEADETDNIAKPAAVEVPIIEANNNKDKEDVKIVPEVRRPNNRVPPGGYSSGLW